MAQPIAIRRASIYRQRARQLAEAYAARHPMGGQRWRARTQDGGRAGSALAGCHLVVRRYGFDRLAEDPPHPGHVRGCPDPVGAGFVDSLARPGGNVTGFMQYLTAPILKTSSGARPATSIAFSGRKAGGSPGAGANQVRAGDQSQDRQSAGSLNSTSSARPR